MIQPAWFDSAQWPIWNLLVGLFSIVDDSNNEYKISIHYQLIHVKNF